MVFDNRVRGRYLDVRATRYQGNGEDCMTRNFMICTWVNKSRKIEIRQTGGNHGREKRGIRGLGGES
jgi:hypothetical protein